MYSYKYISAVPEEVHRGIRRQGSERNGMLTIKTDRQGDWLSEGGWLVPSISFSLPGNAVSGMSIALRSGTSYRIDRLVLYESQLP